jgi:death-on-curing protein
VARYHDTVKYIDIPDFCLIAEAVLSPVFGPIGHSANDLLHAVDLDRLYAALNAPAAATAAGIELHPQMPEKAAILCARIARNHPLPYGNNAVALAAMVYFIEDNGGTWNPSGASDAEIAAVVEAMANQEISVAEFLVWVATHMG